MKGSATPSYKNVSARKRIFTTIVINYYGDLDNDTPVINVTDHSGNGSYYFTRFAHKLNFAETNCVTVRCGGEARET